MAFRLRRIGVVAAILLAAGSLGSALAARPALKTVTATRGPVSATLRYRVDLDNPAFAHPPVRLTIRFHGRVVVDGVPPHCPTCDVNPVGARPLDVRDLDRDGRGEVLLWTYWGGAHCCYDLYVYRQVGSRFVGQQMNFWDSGARMKDLDGDGRLEFVNIDDRFRYLFASFAGSYPPIRIWAYRQGTFVNVTQKFPTLIRRDAAAHWRAFVSARRQNGEVEGVLAGWAADEYLLRRPHDVWTRFEPLSSAGVLKGFGGPSGSAYLAALRRKLDDFGYARAARHG